MIFKTDLILLDGLDNVYEMTTKHPLDNRNSNIYLRAFQKYIYCLYLWNSQSFLSSPSNPLNNPPQAISIKLITFGV